MIDFELSLRRVVVVTFPGLVEEELWWKKQVVVQKMTVVACRSAVVTETCGGATTFVHTFFFACLFLLSADTGESCTTPGTLRQVRFRCGSFHRSDSSLSCKQMFETFCGGYVTCFVSNVLNVEERPYNCFQNKLVSEKFS